jgi:ABC-2 type transport system ATP-binding protein
MAGEGRAGAVMIEASGLGRSFGAKWALRELAFTVRAGDFLGVLGRNGAGKTTLIRILTGQLRPTEGRARLLGLDVADRPLELRRQVGVMPEEGALLEDLGGADYLRLAGRIHGLAGAEVERRLLELQDRLQVDFRASGAIAGYSCGMRKKLAFSAAVLHGPRLLFLDEPFEGLDPAIVQVLLELLGHLHGQGVTVVLTSHLLSLAERLCTRLLLVDGGRLRLEGRPDELLRPGEDLEGLFLRTVGGSGAQGGLTWI